MDVDTGRVIVVKKLFIIDTENHDKLIQEAELVRRLHHRHIVSFLGAEQLDNCWAVYLEYMPGGSLRQTLDRFGPLPESVVWLYMTQVLEGLKYLHSNKIVHRDIKAANVLVTSEGLIKLGDFGCSRLLHEDDLLQSLKGSIPWMAPEVVRQKPYSFAADVWSVGCLCIELLTAQPPWHFDNPMQAIYVIGNLQKAPEIPAGSEGARDFIEACLQLDPANRKTVHELLRMGWLDRPAFGELSNA